MKRIKSIKKPSLARGVIKIVLGALLLPAAAGLLAASVLFRFNEWHELDPDSITGAPKSLLVFDNKGELVSIKGKEKRIWIPIEEIGQDTINAFVSAEDARFYSHTGIDVYRVFGAAWADLKAGSFVQGASTISQQLIKLSHLSKEKTLDRKLEEAVLAISLEHCFDKDKIMEMYLNYIYFGGGYYGIEAASMGYFGVHAGELSVAQSALLAGILKSPSTYAPHLDAEASTARRNNVLRLMREYGYISDETLSSALNEQLELKNGLPGAGSFLIDHSVNEALSILGISEDELLSGGYRIYTTIDSELDDYCGKLMSDPSTYPLDAAQGALVLLDKNCGIAAMAGGRNGYEASGLNRAVDSKRQPGSLIKPILVYSPAMELYGYTPVTMLKDEPKSFGEYEPRNSDEKYYGCVTLRTALVKSLNIPAVSVLSDIGLSSAIMFAQKMGISFDGESAGLPMALGGFTHGVTALEMAGAYSVFMREGVYIKPSSIERIEDSDGRLLYVRRLYGDRVMREKTSFLMTSILGDAASIGTAKKLSETRLPVAAKTGTSIDEGGVRDAWCAAYTPDYTAVIWMGTDSALDGSMPESAVGGNQPAEALAKLFSRLYYDKECPSFSCPEGISETLVNYSHESDGKLYEASENTSRENIRKEYLSEDETALEIDPTETELKAPDNAGWSISLDGYPVITFEAFSQLWNYCVIRKDPEGKETLLFESNGNKGYVSFSDRSAKKGESYVYYVSVDKGDKEKGLHSSEIQVTVPAGINR